MRMPGWIFRRVALVPLGELVALCRGVPEHEKGWKGGFCMYDMRRFEARKLEKCIIDVEKLPYGMSAVS